MIYSDYLDRELTPPLLERTVYKTGEWVERQGWQPWIADTDVETAEILLRCVLGSRVKTEVSHEYAGLVWKQVVENYCDIGGRALERRIAGVLKGGVDLPTGRVNSYPFPGRGAKLCAGALKWFYDSSLPFVGQKVLSRSEARGNRAKIAAECPGLGPKQSSLFLRTLAPAWKLAVLDSHILRYLRLQGLISEDNPSSFRRIGQYERIEEEFFKYVEWLDLDCSLVDFCIWTVMRELRIKIK